MVRNSNSWQYYQNFPDINPKGIVPIGPIPDIESGCEKDWSKIKAGGVVLPS
jgi:putative glutathione S-transferase